MLAVWSDAVVAALTEGTAAALAGDPGVPQEHGQATYAAPFTEEERWLDWRLPRAVLQRQATALNIVVPQTLAQIEGQTMGVLEVKPLPDPRSLPPGTVVKRVGDAVVIAAGDGLVEVIAASSEEP